VARKEDELDDTGSSPVKPPDVDMQDRNTTDSGAKKRLLLEYQKDDDTDMGKEKEDLNTVTKTGVHGMQMDDGTIEKEKDRKKCTKKDKAVSPSLRSAGSREESVRSH
jgi:hypothetical protein